jgi:hypothetical protein
MPHKNTKGEEENSYRRRGGYRIRSKNSFSSSPELNRFGAVNVLDMLGLPSACCAVNR